MSSEGDSFLTGFIIGIIVVAIVLAFCADGIVGSNIRILVPDATCIKGNIVYQGRIITDSNIKVVFDDAKVVGGGLK